MFIKISYTIKSIADFFIIFIHNLLKQCFMPYFIEKSFGILKSKLCVYPYKKDKNTTIVRKITL